ncbi:hypothetical protein [Mucilaginibacter sp.]|jgi:hypothetical protein|uniref:hypothetical protein n=1 Tax=Mucilaginibacter sp. TaxID=1882438 RepID=UPI002C0810C1|nr:hypothetical protein [Mucilaginibacter sp.]HTI59623.1 hypothetical protein [Mucilaginibacter sp.]
MNKTYFFLFFAGILFHCCSLLTFAADHKFITVESTNIADTVKWTKAEVCEGKDSTFVSGQSQSTGAVRCTNINKQIGGIIISISYTLNEGDRAMPVVSKIVLASRKAPSGTDPIKILSSVSEIKGSKIAFSIGAIDTISWHEKSWGAPTTIDGTYDTSNGKYSVRIRQQIPEKL